MFFICAPTHRNLNPNPKNPKTAKFQWRHYLLNVDLWRFRLVRPHQAMLLYIMMFSRAYFFPFCRRKCFSGSMFLILQTFLSLFLYKFSFPFIELVLYIKKIRRIRAKMMQYNQQRMTATAGSHQVFVIILLFCDHNGVFVMTLEEGYFSLSVIYLFVLKT